MQMTARTHMKRKDVDDVLGGEDQWKHADSTPGQLLRLFELYTCGFSSCSPMQHNATNASTTVLTSTSCRFDLPMNL
jgi:hypothetical protein